MSPKPDCFHARFVQRVFLVTTWVICSGAGLSRAQEVAPPKTLEEALAAEFRCPAGTHDSGEGPVPGTVVRWCDIQKDGRPVYHGPLWRWYPSGRLEGKEYYVEGDAAGLWPSYYENGRMSSLGSWTDGQKQGLWKYWDNKGRLTSKVTYSEEGNVRTDYYASGKKKAAGVFTRSGKIGKWTFWATDGAEIASCDFGRGRFAISTHGCQVISDQLDPKGFSPPIPSGNKGDDGSLSVKVDEEIFRFASPQGWIADVKAGSRDELPIVFYPDGKTWEAPGANMYVRVCFKNGRSFARTIKDEKENFEENVADYHEQSSNRGRASTGREYLLRAVTYRPVIETDSPFSIVASNQIHEQTAYVDASGEVVLLVVLTADSDRNLQESLPAFQKVITSLH